MEVSPLEPTNNDNKHHESSKSTLVVDENATGEEPLESDAEGGPGDGSMAQLPDQHDDQNNKNKDDNSHSEDSDEEDAATFMPGRNKNSGENNFNDSETLSGNLESTSAAVQQNGTTTTADSTTNMSDMDVDDADDDNVKGDSADEDAVMADATEEDADGANKKALTTKDDSHSSSAAENASSVASRLLSETNQSTQASSAPTDAQASTVPSETHVNGASSTDAKPTEAPVAQLPVMKGTLCYEEDTRRHLIRGMWNYENSTAFPPQRFELVRTLAPEEELKKLPQDGEFHGSFSLMYTHITSKGKKKERSKVIPESGVKITFTEQDDGSFLVDGKGTNQFGVFLIQGTAKPNNSPVLHDHTFSVELRKRYEEVPVSADKPADGAVPVSETADEPLPPPSQSYPSGVICLKGKLVKEESVETLGVTEVVHRISGMWAAGLNFLTDGGPTNRFEYEHKSSSTANNLFPVSGRYSGWFDLTNEDGSRTRINERDVTLKFRRNNANGYNIEGRGTNVFGKYNITGTLTAEPDNILTIFRHFQPRKIKAKAPGTVAVAPAGAQAATQRRPSITQPFDPILSLDDVETPPEGKNGSNLEPIVPPLNGTYSAVSRGVLRVNDDGTHTCSGKWAATREHFTNGQISPFTFRLESHFAQAAISVDDSRSFPLDSDRYKGSFQLKKQGSRYQTIIDQQVVMKFRLNSQGSYNVYGKGINPIGQFNLVGTLVMSGKTGGQVELYRMYPPSAPAQPVQGSVTAPVPSVGLAKPEATLVRQPSTASLGAQRRESTRLVKLPSKLEDDDPDALLSRTMSKCAQILRAVREKDNEMGNFFAEPVDPVALGIPSYHQIIKEPMDLKTIHRRLETSAVTDPDEFARLVRLVFQNAMTFNVDPAHSVHQAARHLLVFFNQRFREVERIMAKLADEEKAKKGKDDKKRKREGEPPKSLKRMRFEEAQAMATANANFFADIVSTVHANSPTVSRTEFNMLLGHIQQLSKQLVDTHKLLAELSPGDEQDIPIPITAISTTMASSASVASSVPERKKAPKKKSEIVVSGDIVSKDDAKPLTLAEQELLTEFFNEKIDTLTPDDLNTVVQVVRSAAPVGTDEDEIDLEIESLDAAAQRKLLRIVMKYVKKATAKPKKKPKASTKPTPSAGTTSAAPKKTAAAATIKPKPDTGSFFAFGSKGDDSDSDSGDDDDKSAPTVGQLGGKQFSNNAAKEFRLGDGLGVFGDDNEDDDDDAEAGGFAAKWSLPNSSSNQGDDQEDDDDAWGEAREHAAVVKQQEADRKAREEKLQAEAEAAKAQRLKDAAARGEEIKAQRAEEAEKESLLKEQQQKEAEALRDKARAEAKAQHQITQTVNLDAQSEIMKQYEQSYMDVEGGASPSSDFGF